MKSSPAHPLRATVREARNVPGVYRMLAADGEVLYVGKSKSLRTRLLSYLRAPRGDKQHRIIEGTHSLAWDYEPSEFAALLRELQMIKRFRPRMNVQHKRDGRYSFLKLTSGRAPRLFVVSAVADDAATYYGPFRGGRRIQDAVRELNDLLGLRDCPLVTPIRFADQPDLFAFEHVPRCHRFELRLCMGPCAARCTETEYGQRVEMARAFLDGHADEPLRWLNERMTAAADRWEFEYAGRLRDRLHRLENLRDEFSQLREALDSLTFLYRVDGVEGDDRVYLVRRGTVRAVVPVPRTAAERRRMERLCDEHFGRPEHEGALVQRHQVDEILLLSRWFRARPEEMRNTTPPARVEALPLSA
ncbi:GIY-YIG nuclease family protein [Longimicrobium sp.]|uniref:GIY-YIG nuclease family protein n=1 Tax=Longimicrobium sp. TaxID=2029185 RepID=UPI002E334141|nr:GIY-YIG nuclease family protein [Longimicrobium sp.]HEX6039784.1 GIY-YIG nuclease family protein [Longimicrobium sp.]